jgi:lipopolysaccharide export system permease protein
MSIVDRYVGRTVLAAIALMLLAIVGLDMIFRLIDELTNLGGDYQYLQALTYALMTTPSRINEMLPMSALVGCLAGLGSMATSSELVVMRAAGISTGRLIWSAMKPAILLLAVAMLVSEFIAPKLDQMAESGREMKKNHAQSLISGAGLWNREGNEFMHFNVVQPNGVLYGVSIFRYDEERRLQSAIFAKRATYVGNEWLLEKVKGTTFSENRTDKVEHKTIKWRSQLSPDLLDLVSLEAKDLSLRGLWRYSNYLGRQGLANSEYRLAFWQKALLPLSTLSLVLVAISFIFGPLRSVTMGFRIFCGVLVGIVFRTTQNMLGPASVVYGFAPFFSSLIPITICVLVGILLLRRVR